MAGLNWTDVIINGLVLLLSGLFAAYGGHIAAETVPDEKKQSKIKLIFWGMFAVFGVASVWQQIRIAEADLNRETREELATVLSLRIIQPNLAPPAFAYLKKIPHSATVPRSYVVFDGTPTFTQDISNGQLLPPRDLKLDDDLGFNVRYKQSGPNPVELVDAPRWLYLEPDTSDETENALLSDFKRWVRERKKSIPPSRVPTTLHQGEGAYFSQYAVDGTAVHKITEDDLRQLRGGKRIVYIITEIDYRDHGNIHHLRRCLWLQPPATVPGIWHFCNLFNNSD